MDKNTKVIFDKLKDMDYKFEKIVSLNGTQIDTKEDLDWTNEKSRSSIEMKNELSRPEIKEGRINIDNYDTIILGFPVWWYKEPTIINTFIENYDLTNKDIYVFVTSGSSSVDSSLSSLKNKYPSLNFVEGKRLSLNQEYKDVNDIFEQI